MEASEDPEEDWETELRWQRCHAYFAGTDFDIAEEVPEEVPEELPEDCPAEAPSEVTFTDEELQEWGAETAVQWILGAKNSFEVLGISLACPDLALLRNRYRRLSLLVHPDKNKETEAAQAQATEAFQRLSDAMRVLVDDTEREKLKENIETTLQQACPHSAFGTFPEEDIGKPEDSDEDVVNQEVRARVMQRSNFSRHGKRKKSSSDLTARMAAKAAKAAQVAQAATQHQPVCQATAPHTALTSEQLTELWRREVLTESGWKRLESRRQPGTFYFAHSSGLTVMQSQWEMRQSRRDPNVHYWVNFTTGETSLSDPNEKRNV